MKQETPKYYQISQDIIDHIRSGRLKPGMQILSENEIIKHRLKNPGTQLLSMTEVAYGEVQDADKVRYEDRYGCA